MSTLVRSVSAPTASQISNAPAGGVAALNIQAAINELDTEKAAVIEVNASFDALQLADYAELRAYAGARKSVYVTGYLIAASPLGIAGMFVRDDSDITTADNGGTVLVRADGKRYKRAFMGAASIQWFGAVGVVGRDNWTDIQRCFDVCPSVYIPNAPADYEVSKPLVVHRAFSTSIASETREGAIIKKIGIATSGEAAVMCPAGLAAATLDVYDVDAVLIIKAPAGDFNRDINIDKLTLKRGTKAGYSLYAPRISLSSFRDVDVFGADKGIYSASPWMINWTRCTARDCRANWILGDAAATNGGGTSNTLLSCWAAGTAIGRAAYDCYLNYSAFNGCGADFIGYADDGVTTGPAAAIYKFTNSNVTMNACGAEESRGPIVLAINSMVSVDGFHSYHYYADWTAQPYQYAFVALAGSVVSVRNPDVIMEGASIAIKWGLSDGARSSLSFYDNKTYPEINAYTTAAYAPVTSGGGALRITNAKHNYQSTSGGNGAAESSVIDGSFGSNYGQGTWNTGHLVLGQWHLWSDAGILRMKASAPTFTSDGSVVGAQT